MHTTTYYSEPGSMSEAGTKISIKKPTDTEQRTRAHTGNDMSESDKSESI